MTRFSVPDMNCGHCRASVQSALQPLTTRLEIDLAAREITTEGATPAAVIRALDAVGFPARALD